MPDDAAERRALAELHSHHSKMLNRLLACEAVLHGLIRLMQPAELRELAQHLDDSVPQAMAQLPPAAQQMSVWEDLHATIENTAERRRTAPGAPAA